MPIWKLVIFRVMLLVHVFSANGQSNKIKSLFDQLQSAPHDTDRVDIYYGLSKLYWNKNADSALLMGQKALELSQKIHFEKGIALSLLTKGVALVAKGRYPEALNCHLQALRISEKLGMEGLTGNNYNNIGIVYMSMGNYPKALHYLRKSLKIAQKDTAQYVGYGLLVNIAEIYSKNNKPDSAIAYNMLALKIVRQAQDSLGMAITLFNIGDNSIKKGQPRIALGYLQESLEISKKVSDYEGIAYSYNAMARACQQLQQFSKSNYYATNSLQQAAALGMHEIQQESYNILYLNHQQSVDFKKALHYRNLEISLRDSLYTIEKEKQVNNLQSIYEIEKKQHQIDLLNKDKVIQQQAAARQKFLQYILGFGLLLLGLLAFFLYRSNAGKKLLNQLLKKQNQEMARQNGKLEELNVIKNKLLSIIGHDLRGPVGTLQGVVGLMKDNQLSGEEIRYIGNKLNDNLVSTATLLDNLLFWAKSQMEGMSVNARAFDVQPIIRQSIMLLQSQANDKQVILTMEATAAPVTVYADEAMIDIVIRNLLANAIKFSTAGNTVQVTTAAGRSFVHITVKDEGLGIPKTFQHKIFDIAASFTTSGTARERGSGLGLVLCKELVEKNGGKIWFVSEEGKGSAFTFAISSVTFKDE